MELDFHKSPAILADIVDAMSVGVFTVDAGGKFRGWSQGAERITGYSRDEMIGKSCQILEGPNCEGFAKLAHLLQQNTIPEAGVCSQECKLMSKDGQERNILGNVRLLTDEAGDLAGAVGSFTDTTSILQDKEKIALLQRQALPDDAFERLIGRSAPMREVIRQLQLAADSDVTVLLSGESGTGKELAAQAIHRRSARRDKPFLAINCSAIPESLLESELFGHVKGAFTGATVDKLGLFEGASGGTLFLDEIGEVTPAIQVKLLRVLQEREIRRVGDSRSRRVEVRWITATNQDLQTLVAASKIREDFYYRIHVFEIVLPPLRQRREDIPLLVEHFLRAICRGSGKPVDGISKDALKQLMDYHWPGNVRQLRNAIEHACVVASGDRLNYLDLPVEIRDPKAFSTAVVGHLTEAEFAERESIVDALRRTGGNRTKAAELLGTSRVTLWKKINRYAIDVPG